MRTLDAAAINAIIAHPEVRPWVGMADPLAEIDLTAQVQNINNFAFLTPQKDGAYLLVKLQAGLYAAHSMAVPEARGKPMLRLMRSGFRTLFTESDCVEVVTQLPDTNDAARAWAHLAGFRLTYRREACFPLLGEMVGVQFASLDYQTWAINDHENARIGAEFHEQIHGHGLANHPEDKVHDALVGATIAGVQKGNTVKAIGLFNRWASLAGYQQANILSLNPPLIDTGDAVLGLLNGAVDVLLTKAKARSASLS